jgi:hypothetical protein
MRHRNPKVAVLVIIATVAAGASTAAGASQSSTDAPAPRALATGTSARAASSSALRDAVALVRSKGYTPDSTRHYKSWATLRVLVATATGSASGHNQQAFFFVGRQYIGTATWVPTASLAYVGQTSTRVRLRYGVFGPGSGDCCPTSHRIVRFKWNGRRLVALDPIP